MEPDPGLVQDGGRVGDRVVRDQLLLDDPELEELGHVEDGAEHHDGHRVHQHDLPGAAAYDEKLKTFRILSFLEHFFSIVISLKTSHLYRITES